MAKSSYLTALLLGATLTSGASAQTRAIPVEDRSASPAQASQPRLPAAVPQVRPVLVAPAPAVGSAQGSVAELLMLIEELQHEVRQLRGMVEEQRYEMRQLRDGQRDRYRDLDRRLSDLSERVQKGAASQPSSSLAPEPATLGLATSNGAPRVADRQAYNEAFALVRQKAFSKSLSAFEAFVRDYPDSALLPNAYYWTGEVYRALPEPDLSSAQSAYLKVVDGFPEHGKVPDALYKLALTYEGLGNRPKARELMQRVVADYPDQAPAKLAREYLARSQ